MCKGQMITAITAALINIINTTRNFLHKELFFGCSELNFIDLLHVFHKNAIHFPISCFKSVNVIVILKLL